MIACWLSVCGLIFENLGPRRAGKCARSIDILCFGSCAMPSVYIGIRLTIHLDGEMYILAKFTGGRGGLCCASSRNSLCRESVQSPNINDMSHSDAEWPMPTAQWSANVLHISASL